jgi:hypothetical protein
MLLAVLDCLVSTGDDDPPQPRELEKIYSQWLLNAARGWELKVSIHPNPR